MDANDLKKMRPKDALLIIKALGLRKRYEEVLILNYVEDLSICEIAEKLHMAEQSVSNLNTKAKKQFNKYIEELHL